VRLAAQLPRQPDTQPGLRRAPANAASTRRWRIEVKLDSTLQRQAPGL